VIHHSELLAKLIRDGRLTPAAGEEFPRIVFHDSCYLGRYNGIYDAPRQVPTAMPGVELSEAERSRVNGMCCGAGGGLMFRDEHIGERINQLRLKQLVSANAGMVASACPYCLVMLRDAVNELDLSDKVKTADVAELLARRVGV